MGEPKKRKPVFQRALENTLGLDEKLYKSIWEGEGEAAMYDHTPIRKAGTRVTQEQSNASIVTDISENIERSIDNQRYGRRTFPTAVNVGAATPMYRNNQELDSKQRTKQLSKIYPFYTDPETGDIDLKKGAFKWTFGANSMPKAEEAHDRTVWPAYRVPDKLDAIKPVGTDTKERIRKKVDDEIFLWNMIQKATGQNEPQPR